MAIRNSTVARLIVMVGAVLLMLYTLHMYMDLFERWLGSDTSEDTGTAKADPVQHRDDKKEVELVKKPELPKLPGLEMHKYPCDMTKECAADGIGYRIVSGAANIIGPSLCVNGKWLMSNTQNNVGRGLNVAVVDGRTGDMIEVKTFDLYKGPSANFVKFLEQRPETDIMLFATYDDASNKMDASARKALEKLGSKSIKDLGFRDNWIFAGGKKLATGRESYMKNQPEKNKYGKWPGLVTVEGCFEKLK